MIGEHERVVQAIVVDEDAPGRLAIRPVLLSEPKSGEMTVRVNAISFNRGEVKRALSVERTGARPGWDFAGVVETECGTPGAPAVGTRVVGVVPSGAWAERVHVSPAFVATIPDEVADTQAASLPVAGLTALHALRKGGLLLGRKVLIDGATGGVGQFAVQLAAASGAQVFAHVRRTEQRCLVERWSTGAVVAGPTLEAARPFGPFDLILDSVGGLALSVAMTLLRKNGTCVTFGRSEGEQVRFDGTVLFDAPGASLRSMILNDELAATEPAAHGLAILLGLIVQGTLAPTISVQAPWTEAPKVARRLMDREFAGKAVLQVPH